MVEVEQVLATWPERAVREVAGPDDGDPVLGHDLDARREQPPEQVLAAEVDLAADGVDRQSDLHARRDPVGQRGQEGLADVARLVAVDEQVDVVGRGRDVRRASAGSSAGRGAAGRPRSRSPAHRSGRGRRGGPADGRRSRRCGRRPSRPGWRPGRMDRSGPACCGDGASPRSRPARHRARSSDVGSSTSPPIRGGVRQSGPPRWRAGGHAGRPASVTSARDTVTRRWRLRVGAGGILVVNEPQRRRASDA